MPAAGPDDLLSAGEQRAAYGQFAGPARRDHHTAGLARGPFDVDGESSPGAQSAHGAVRPGCGKCGENVHGVVLALQQHLRDTRGGTEVSVDLEGRVGVPEVGEGGALQLFREHLVRVAAVPEPRPEVDLPCLGPAGATVPTGTQGDFGGFGPGAPGLDLTAGVEAEEVGDMAVIVGRVVPVGLPLLELAPGADAQAGVEVVEGRFETVTEGGCLAEGAGGLQGAGEEVVDDLLGHGCPGGEVPVLG